ncbi:MAG: sigma-70 family RNA polymerase sigma factor [Prevotella sp.]|nr:sigma-70 family RNA polymerase sigma factor [Prevotella sp.]MDY6131263.1 sigma-70 family RNA polymerase sigma factor [Prevotella sp.]
MKEKKSVDTYLKEIGRQDLLTADKERALSERIKAGDEAAVGELVGANLKYVVTVAKQYRERGLDFEDLVSEGNIGMMKAARKFDAARGGRFVSFAATYIRNSMETALERQAGSYEMPAGESVGEKGKRYAPFSMEAPIPEGSTNNITLLHVLENKDARCADEEVNLGLENERLLQVIACLSEREQMVVRCLYGIGRTKMTMAEVGMESGLKRERVRQIRDQALRKLRKKARQA